MPNQVSNSVRLILKPFLFDCNKTREPIQKPICDITTSHTARKTFIGNLYKKVKDPNLVASLSGHTDGSRAFARYREIDNEMKRELVKLID